MWLDVNAANQEEKSIRRLVNADQIRVIRDHEPFGCILEFQNGETLWILDDYEDLRRRLGAPLDNAQVEA